MYTSKSPSASFPVLLSKQIIHICARGFITDSSISNKCLLLYIYNIVLVLQITMLLKFVSIENKEKVEIKLCFFSITYDINYQIIIIKVNTILGCYIIMISVYTIPTNIHVQPCTQAFMKAHEPLLQMSYRTAGQSSGKCVSYTIKVVLYRRRGGGLGNC